MCPRVDKTVWYCCAMFAAAGKRCCVFAALVCVRVCFNAGVRVPVLACAVFVVIVVAIRCCFYSARHTRNSD